MTQRTCAHTGGLAGLDDAECGCNTCLCDANDINAVPTGDGTCKPVSGQFKKYVMLHVPRTLGYRGGTCLLTFLAKNGQ